MLNNFKKEINLRKAKGIRAPSLSAILVGYNEASEVYVKNKIRACKFTGVSIDLIRLSDSCTQKQLHEKINQLNESDQVDGIIVQLPLPSQLNQELATSQVHWTKDVDGFHPFNIGRLALGDKSFVPATVSGIVTLIDHEIGINWLRHKNICIVGRSNHICKPLEMWLQNSALSKRPGADATVTIVHEETPDNMVIDKLLQADMIITATGRNEQWLIGDYIKDGSIIIDVAFNRCQNTGKLFGDCDYDSCNGIASLITPVPGGVGPLTVSELVKNTIIASTRTHKINSSIGKDYFVEDDTVDYDMKFY